MAKLPDKPDHALLYDADCGFCTRTADRIIRLDRRRRLRAVSIQSPLGQELLDPIPEELRLESWHLVGPGGEVRSAGPAAPHLLRLLPGGRPAAALLAAFPAITDAAYRWVARNREHFGRFLVLALALVMVGCGSSVRDGTELSVYASLPLSGSDAREGREALVGAELALARAGGEAGGAPVRLEALDDVDGDDRDGGWTQASVSANARTAARDSTAIAYLGELESDATRVSTAITNEAGIPQISPGPVSDELLREPGGNDPPEEVQATGDRTLLALRESGAAPRQVEPSVAADLRGEIGREPGPAAAYGYEAMALALDAIDRAEDPLDRDSVTRSLLETADRPSPLGTYTIGPIGLAGFD